MPTDVAAPFDRALVARRRDRFASGVADVDFLLRRVADDLCERLQFVQREFPRVLDLGAHHGLVTRAIRQLPSVGRVVAAERSAALLALNDGPAVLCDEEALPFAQADFDLVVSALTLQYVNDLPGTLIQIRRALKPDGLLLAALPGGETLKELRHAWLVAEAEITGGASPRVAPFVDVRDLGSLAQRAGFALPVVDSDTLIVTYESPLALIRELRAMAASNPLTGRRRLPVTKSLFVRACEIYTREFADAGGRVPATFEILTLTAWSPDESQPKPLAPGSAQVSLADVLKKR